MSPPVALSSDMAGAINLTPRFAIWAERGGDPRKIRVIDDLRASGANSVAAMHNTAAPDCLECLLALAVYYRHLSPGCVLKAAPTDFCRAYRTIGLPPGRERFSAVLLGPPTGSLLVSHLETHPFGIPRAPGNWGRVATLSKWIIITCLGVHIPVYVGDCFRAELAETIDSAFARINLLAGLYGFNLAKEQAPGGSISLIGAHVVVSHDGVTAVLPECQRHDLVRDLEMVLGVGCLTPSQSAKLRGGLAARRA